ncbi:sugar ABC transporter permease [Nakamurella sp.]|uniref:sugar ABC transporter permease n=1 Tax=Nakamurella sp. TaxID=1869182 RepID=UPI003783988F
MSVDTSTPAPATETKLKAERMPFGRWMRIVGWRHIVAIIMVIWALFPALYVINLAFSGSNSLNAACPSDRTGFSALLCLVPNNLSLDNFTAILTSDQFPFAIWFRNTIILATLNSALALLMGACAAFAFSRLRFKGRRMGLLTLMLVQMFPAVLALTAIFILLQSIGDVFPLFGLRSIWGLLLVYLGGALGVNTFLMKGFFDTIPVDIDESARIDGAGHVKIFFGLIMRLALPILVVVFFVSFTSTFNELPMAAQILPDPDNTTLAVGLRSLVIDPLRQQWGLMAAGGLIAAIPMLLVFAVTQRSLTTGLTAGAVKG